MKAIDQFENIYGVRLSKKRKWEFTIFLVCLEIVISFSYLGYLQIAPISVTTLHILVIVAAMLFGPLDAVIVSLVFAMTSMWKATSTSTELGDLIFSPFFSGNPVGSIIMTIGTRIAFALIAGYVFRWYFSKKRRHEYLGISLLAVAATLVHNALVYACMSYFFGADTAQTSEEFQSSLVMENAILLAVTVLVCCVFHAVLKSRTVKDSLNLISEDFGDSTILNSRSMRLLAAFTFFVGVFVCLHLVSRLNQFITTYSVDSQYADWVKSLTVQFFLGYIGLFGAVFILFRWMRDKNSALAFEKTKEAQKAADEANASKTAFLFNMSHDIRTPMNAITGYTAMARRHIHDEEAVDGYLKKIDTSSQQLLSLVNKVLDMSRIESGHVTLEKSDGDIVESASLVSTIVEANASEKDIKLTFDASKVRDRYVNYDSERVGQILLNILSNSVKYTPEGGEIFYSVEQKDGYDFLFTVEDTGIGMSKEYLDHIFEEFTRENSSTISQIQGTGLGMSIVKKIVDLMDGTIEIESEKGRGTKVSILLPLGAAEGTSEIRTSEVPTDFTFEGKHVLLVEDNEMNREIARDILEESGIIVTEADDGSSALEIMKHAHSGDFDLILMDIQMPVMNGFECTEKIRVLDGDISRIPIVAMTANAFEEDRKAALEHGMDEHIAKPINIVHMKATMARLMSRNS